MSIVAIRINRRQETISVSKYSHKYRALDSRTRTTTGMRFDLKFFCVLSKYRHPEFFIVLFFTTKVSTVIYLPTLTPYIGVSLTPAG